MIRIFRNLIKIFLVILWAGLSATISFFASAVITGFILMASYILIDSNGLLLSNDFFKSPVFIFACAASFLLVFIPGLIFIVKMNIFKDKKI